MTVLTSKILTRQFYEWEQRGRGHTLVDFTAELEPPFIPFFGHFIDMPYIDDGRRHTLFSGIKSLFVPDHTVAIPEPPTQETVAFADIDESPSLTVYAISLPKNYTAK